MTDKKYFDFHAHILPGIDDGAFDWDMTKQMLREEYQQGVTTIIATPHNYPNNVKQDNQKIRKLCGKAEAIAKEIDQEMRVLPGNEIYFRWGILEELKKENILTLADTPYLLVEFSIGEGYERIYRGLKELVEAGYYPVIAHMERLETILFKEKHLDELLHLGCYMQVNCESIMGGIFDKTAARLRKYLETEKIHFLGSDCHNVTTRRPVMGDCINKLSKKHPKQKIERLVYDNPTRFSTGKYI